MNQAPTPVDESQKPATSRWRSPVLSRLRALAARHPWVNVYLAVCLVCLPVGPLPVAHGSPEEEEWTMDHSESVVEVSLLASAASVYSGETVGLSVTVQRHSWEVWVSDWGNVETREDSYEAIPEADLSWSLSSGTGTLEGASETDGQGAASGTFVLNSSSDVRVAVLDNGVETGSAEIHIEETTVEETWGLSQSVSELEVVFQPVEGGPLLAQGAVRTLSAEARWHGYEVWTSNLGNSENRSESYTAAEGATVTFTVLSGEQSSLDGQTTRSYTADSSGVVSTSFTMGTVEATVGVTATQGPTEVTGSPLTLTYSPPVEEWSFDRHETVHTLALSAEGGVTQAAQETQIPLTAHAVQIVRDVWVSNLGNTRYENVVTTDAGGLLVSFHVNQVLEGSFQPNSVFTGTDGLAPTVFFMGGVDAHLSARARDANGTELCSVSMEIGSTAEEIWTKLRDETTLAVSIDPGGSTVDVPRNTQYTATVSVNHESWEVWRSNRGGMDIRNLTSGAASGAAVSFSSESSPIYTNSSGTASTTVTIGAQSVLLVADVAFRTATGVASVDYSPADAWVLQGSDELLTVDSSLSNGLSVMVSHSTWDVFRNIDDNTTEIRNRVTLPAGGAQVSMSMSNGTFSGDQSWTTSFADNNGVASASYTRTSIYSDTEFNVSASYMGLTASAPPLTVPGLPSPPRLIPTPPKELGA